MDVNSRVRRQPLTNFGLLVGAQLSITRYCTVDLGSVAGHATLCRLGLLDAPAL